MPFPERTVFVKLNKPTAEVFVPDALGYLLTGTARNEFTIATTSQLYDPRAGRYAAPGAR